MARLETQPPATRPWWRWLGYALGLAGFAAAAALAVGGLSIERLATVGLPGIAALAGLSLVNLLLAGALQWVVTLSFDAQPTVRFWRMAQLMAASALLNYLPLRAGLLGRAAYLKRYHALPVRQSLLGLAAVLAVAVAVSGAAGAALLLPADWRWWAMAGLLILLMLATGPTAAWALRRPIRYGWSWPLLRAADLAVQAVRLWVALRLAGYEASPERALAAAAGAVIASLTGLTPNGLGLREWVVAAIAQAGGALPTRAGLEAAVIDRSAEAALVLVAGGLAVWLLRKNREAPLHPAAQKP